MLHNSPWCFVLTEASMQNAFIPFHFNEVTLFLCFLNVSQDNCDGFLLCSLNRRFRIEISRCNSCVIHGNWSSLMYFFLSGACLSNTSLYRVSQKKLMPFQIQISHEFHYGLFPETGLLKFKLASFPVEDKMHNVLAVQDLSETRQNQKQDNTTDPWEFNEP